MSTPISIPSREEELNRENAELRARLEKAEDTLRGIRKGDIQALVVESAVGPTGFTLRGRDAESNRVRGEILAQVSDAVIAVDTDQRVTYLNAAAERQYGLVAETTLGSRLTDLYGFRWLRAEDEAEAMTSLRERGEWRGENIHVTRAGRELHVESSVTVTCADDGSPLGMIAVIRDNTARKLAEADLQRSEYFLKRVTDVTPGVIQVVDLDEQRSVFANRSLTALLGYTPEDIDAMGVGIVTTLMHPEDLARFPEHLSQVRALQDEEIAEFEHRMRDKSGAWRWFYSRGAVFRRDADGAVAQLIGTAIEITARKRDGVEAQRVSALFGSILHTAPIGFCFLDLDLRYVRINARLAEMNGLSAEAHLGRHVSEIVPALADALVALTECILVTGEPVLNHEFSGETPALPGVTRWWSESWYPVRDGAGEISGFGAVVEEITARKEADDALWESHQFTSRVLDSNLAAFVGVSTADGTLTYANRAPLEAAGISASEVLGKKFWDCYWWNYSPEIQSQLREACERAANGEIVRYDVPVRMAGDTRVWIDFQVAPLRDEDGRITHLIPSAMEITMRRAAEERQRESEARTRLATEATAVGIWERNLHNDALRWDAQMFQLYGIPPTADGFVQYADWRETLLPEDLPETERVRQETVRLGGQNRREFRIRRRDNGAVRYVESVETVRANAQGAAEWVVGTNLDVTERKLAEMQLRQLAADLSEADRQKDEFLATLAHELRNPLAPIRNGLELMKQAGEQAAVERTREMMERQLTQLVRLVDDLTDVSRISRGSLELRKERVSLAAVVESALESSRPLIERMGHELTVKLPKEPVILEADLTRLAQVFLNLLNNAAKYSDQRSHIHMNVERDGTDIVVTVKDNGIGIAADQLSRVFGMFTQVVRSLDKAQGGLGIGLTLVKRLVEMHGGTVEAKSDGPGKGSEFIVRLPVVIATEETRELARVAERPVMMPRRILVVDDNVDAANSLSELLKLLGNDTRTAGDGQEGVDMAAEFRPEAILLDIGLPKLDGYEVCRSIRAQPWGTDILLVAITGWGQPDDRRRSREAGFDHHMVKPVDPRALMALLAEFRAGHDGKGSLRIDRAGQSVARGNGDVG